MAGPSTSRSSNGKEKAKFSTWKGPWCVLHQGERGVPVLEYLKQFGDIIRTDPPPGESVTEVAGSLVDPAKEVIFKLISMVFRELEGGLYFTSLALKNIFVNHDGLVKIRDGNVLKVSTSNKVQEDTVYALANAVESLVSSASAAFEGDKDINPELKHLLDLLRAYRVGKSTYLMKHHPCNVPDANRGFYCIILHDETMHVLRFNDPETFHYVIDGVLVPADWYAQMQAHSILKRYLVRGHYDPAGGVPKLVPVKCLRNVPSHGREDAGDANTPFFTRADIARSVYDKLPMAVCSMAQGLDVAGILRTLGLESLFPGRVSFLQSS